MQCDDQVCLTEQFLKCIVKKWGFVKIGYFHRKPVNISSSIDYRVRLSIWELNFKMGENSFSKKENNIIYHSTILRNITFCVEESNELLFTDKGNWRNFFIKWKPQIGLVWIPTKEKKSHIFFYYILSWNSCFF